MANDAIELEIAEIVTEFPCQAQENNNDNKDNKDNKDDKVTVRVRFKGQREVPGESTHVSLGETFSPDLVKQITEGRKSGARFYVKVPVPADKKWQLLIVNDHS